VKQLLERESELAAVEVLLERGGVLVVEGRDIARVEGTILAKTGRS
jgi:hypothetical protein